MPDRLRSLDADDNAAAVAVVLPFEPLQLHIDCLGWTVGAVRAYARIHWELSVNVPTSGAGF